MSPHGGFLPHKEADKHVRRMAERMSAKRGETYQTYSSVVSFLRRRFRFDLLKTGIRV